MGMFNALAHNCGCGVGVTPDPHLVAATPETVYVEEHSVVTRIEIARSKFSGLGEDKTSFEVVSHWSAEGVSASQVGRAAACEVSAAYSSNISARACTHAQTTRQSVWRTFADFRTLHKQLSAAVPAFAAVFPKSQWCVLRPS